VYALDGETVLFSSNRAGNLDLWTVSTSTGAVRRVTDDSAEDWDPAFTRDGSRLLWSSNRGGHLEVWIADVDGSGARQVTHDGVDAATHLVPGPFFLPEVSPAGRHALYGTADPAKQRNLIRVVEIESGTVVPFEIEVRYSSRVPAALTLGRSRWMPDGRSIAFLGTDDTGRLGVYAQDFAPGRDTSATRRPLAGFDSELTAESFGISPDGSRLVLASRDGRSGLMIAEGVPGVGPARTP
jgi:Tol biopolymer transport system component